MGDTCVPVDASLTQYRELSLLSPNYGRGPASTRRVVDVDLFNGGIVEESVEFGVELSSIDRDRVDHHAAAIEGPNGQLPNGELFWKICEITRGVARVGVQENRARRPVGGVGFRIERVVRDEYERFADLGVTEAMTTRIPRLLIGDVRQPAQIPQRCG
jgi:hypothetical protein